ncbi:MAG: sugar ABC transporter permease [Chloroflexi bacterium]|nr:sugar ABC transporter permease [Chloroflexota bacterium]
MMQRAVTTRKRTSLAGWLTEPTLAGMRRRKALLGYLFVLPTILGILVFTAGPVLVSFGLSLYKWNVFRPPTFVGLENYTRLVSDTRVLVSFANSARFVILAIGLQIVFSLLLALALRQRMATWMRYYFRTTFLLPFLLSGAATGVVLSYLLHQEFGVVNYYLGLLGIPRIPWLTSSDVVLYTVVLAYLWQFVGFSLITMLGGLSNISSEVLDAAEVDGASGWNWLWQIVLPMLSPTLLFSAVIGVIGGLQIFDQPYVMTRGGPGDASRTAVMTLYEAAFKNQEIGYASSIAVILFVVILAITAFQFAMSKRWVFYQ